MPPTKYEFDDTRAALGVNDLDPAERKKLLEQFKAAGGQVLRERSLDEKRKEERRQQVGSKIEKGQTSGPEIKLPSELRREQARAEAERAQRARVEYEKALKRLKSPAARFLVRLRCFFAGVTPFSGKVLKPAFVQFLNLELKQAFVEFNLLGNDLFLQRPSIGRKILQNLDAKNPLLMETLEYAHHMYKAEFFSPFAEAAQANAPLPLEAAAAAIKSIYRAIYILYPFQETFRKAMGYALDIFIPEAQAAKVSAESLQGLSIKQKRFHNNTKIVFQVAFPKLFNLVCLIDGTDYPPFSPLLEKAIQVTPQDKLGQRQRGDSTSLETTETPAESPQQANAEAQPEEKKQPEKKGGVTETKEYQYGMALMRMFNPQQLLERHDKTKRMLEKVPINDRILLAYLFFLEFDHEYSFVLTTNKIQINADYSGGVKSDYKKQMADIYNESRAILNAYKKYEEMVQEYKTVKERKSANYVEKAKQEEKAKARADMEGRNTRGLIRGFMDNVVKMLGILINDMRGPKQIVGNMDDIVKFDSELEKGKRLNGKPVKQCIMEAYCYATAFRERLANGDLFPLTPMTDEEMQAAFGQSLTQPTEVPEAQAMAP
ncbi:MAG: hypothetical protein N2Z22_07845 [Turneriella sp.]|nr:hypothetical protein [Turneriella sp.]